MTLLVLGQSNAANHGVGRGRSPFGAIWFDGRCYAVVDPLPGGTGSGGSIWSRLLDSIVPVSGRKDYLLVVLAVNATRVSDWTRDGPLSLRLTQLIASLQTFHLSVAAVLWQQGEADAQRGTLRGDYAAAMATLISRLRGGGIVAPVLLARSTRCRNSGSDEVRGALAQIAQQQPNVFLGPDIDSLGDDFRSDGCHLSGAGLKRAADAWMEALVERGIVARR